MVRKEKNAIFKENSAVPHWDQKTPGTRYPCTILDSRTMINSTMSDANILKSAAEIGDFLAVVCKHD